MSPFRAEVWKFLWDDVKQEPKGIAGLVVALVAVPTAFAAFSGHAGMMAISALPCAVLGAAMILLSRRGMRGEFGPAVAKRIFTAHCLLYFFCLITLLGLVVRYMIFNNELPALAALGWGAVALSCFGMMIVWRMYKSGIAVIAKIGHL